MIKPGYKKEFLFYVLKFTGLFIFIYAVTLAVIGFSAPGGYYSSMIHNYFDYVSWLRSSLLYTSKGVLFLFGYDTNLMGKYLLRLKNGFGVRMVYSCLGYGIMSFWIAFICANKGSVKHKFLWIFSGLFLIWMINIARICLLLLAANKHWRMPFNLDHHTIFNIAAYFVIFILMYFYDRSGILHQVNTQKL